MSKFPNLTDNELINKIKKEFCSDSMEELINRHEDLYFSTVHRYYRKNPESNLQDLLDDLYIIFNKAVESYNDNKNTKFSTYLAYLTYWHALNFNKNKNKTVCYENKDIDLINESNNRFYTFKDNIEEINNYLFNILNQLEDKRISEIYKQRYIEGGQGNKVKSWNEIGKDLNLSTSHIINLYNRGKKYLYNKLTSNQICDKVI